MIERLEAGALAQLDALERAASADSTWSRSLLAAALEDPAREVWGWREREFGVVRGYCVLGIGVFDLELEIIGVSPDWRRRGIALALLEHCASRAVALGKERILLEVRVSNQGAIALYRRAGYAEDGVRRGYYPDAGGGREDALLMSRGTAVGRAPL
ncbi:GNAT family N-acetyltransferase [Halotalea alkalilenta]|uniref:GNAT family N-acetyltransferase n=1 Tax=Halotalea alkalilenta TaxID=376489 RepID=UPI0004889ED6|nr:GNAT family N-acetyltransferase [Halotalea alkalilenta]